MGHNSVLDRFNDFGMSLTKYVNAIGVFFLFAMMMVTTVDVLSRFLFNQPVTGSIEITGFLLLITVFFGIPYAAARDTHISIDIITSNLSDRRRLTLNALTGFVALLLFILLAWQSVDHSILNSNMHRVTAVMELPIAPFVLIVSVSSVLFCYVVLIRLLKNIKLGRHQLEAGTCLGRCRRSHCHP